MMFMKSISQFTYVVSKNAFNFENKHTYDHGLLRTEKTPRVSKRKINNETKSDFHADLYEDP